MQYIYILYTKNSWDAIFHRSSIDEDRNVIIIKNKEIIERLMDDRGLKKKKKKKNLVDWRIIMVRF